jgi:hypothetical protein
MNAETYAEWLRRQGHKVIRTASSYWHSDGLGVYQAFPYHLMIDPSGEELRDLMSNHRVVALRYSMHPCAERTTDSYHAVYTGSDYDIGTLSGWARKNVRRGLRSCVVGQISFERYADEGWDLRVDTLARQERRMKDTRDRWRKRCSGAADLHGFEVWAAQVENKLAATLLIFQMDGWAYMVYQQCHRNYLRQHVNNALSFEVTQNLIRRPNVRGVFYGMRSLDAPASVDEFKFRMGYEARPVRQRVAFHPFLALLVNSPSYRLLRALVRFDPGSRALSKADGMFRLFLEEKGLPHSEKLSSL